MKGRVINRCCRLKSHLCQAMIKMHSSVLLDWPRSLSTSRHFRCHQPGGILFCFSFPNVNFFLPWQTHALRPCSLLDICNHVLYRREQAGELSIRTIATLSYTIDAAVVLINNPTAAISTNSNTSLDPLVDTRFGLLNNRLFLRKSISMIDKTHCSVEQPSLVSTGSAGCSHSCSWNNLTQA